MKIKTNVKAGATPTTNHSQTQVRKSAALRRIKTFCAGFAIMAGLLGQAAYAQATTTVVSLDRLSCTTSAGLSAFTATSWSLSVDPTQKVPPVITVTKPRDGCSAALHKALTEPKGYRAKAASITVRDSKGSQLEYISFFNAMISGYSTNGGGSAPTETLSFTFSDYTIQWQ